MDLEVPYIYIFTLERTTFLYLTNKQCLHEKGKSYLKRDALRESNPFTAFKSTAFLRSIPKRKHTTRDQRGSNSGTWALESLEGAFHRSTRVLDRRGHFGKCKSTQDGISLPTNVGLSCGGQAPILLAAGGEAVKHPPIFTQRLNFWQLYYPQNTWQPIKAIPMACHAKNGDPQGKASGRNPKGREMWEIPLNEKNLSLRQV